MINLNDLEWTEVEPGYNYSSIVHRMTSHGVELSFLFSKTVDDGFEIVFKHDRSGTFAIAVDAIPDLCTALLTIYAEEKAKRLEVGDE
jgi:hypothetical protein